MFILAMGMFFLSFLEVGSAYLFFVSCLVLAMIGISLAMPPMTAAVMSGVPTRRAGAGSATNDATRELGGSLGIAVIGSIAASRYASEIAPSITKLSPRARDAAEGSLAGGIRTASGVPGAAGRALATHAKHAFVNGIHFAGTTGAVLCMISVGIVLRYLPRPATHGASQQRRADVPAGSAEAGAAPAFADD
jgi:hypothetical protein